jgi:hypothetical protein
MTETIHQSILKVSAAIGAIGKDKRADIKTQSGQNFSYQFRGIDDVLDALHPALIECGVTITPQVQAVLPIQDGVLLTIDYLIGNVAGETIVATFVGEGRDRGDKAAQKAQSNAYKYMAFQTFCIPVDVADSDNNQYEQPEDKPPSLAEKRMKKIKDAAWIHTTGTEEDRIAETKKIVAQVIASYGGEPRNQTDVDAIISNIEEMFNEENDDG